MHLARETRARITSNLLESLSMAATLGSGTLCGWLAHHRRREGTQPAARIAATVGSAVLAATLSQTIVDTVAAEVRKRHEATLYPALAQTSERERRTRQPETLAGAVGQLDADCLQDLAHRAAAHAWQLDRGDGALRQAKRWTGHPDGTATLTVAPNVTLRYTPPAADDIYLSTGCFEALAHADAPPIVIASVAQLRDLVREQICPEAPAETEAAAEHHGGADVKSWEPEDFDVDCDECEAPPGAYCFPACSGYNAEDARRYAELAAARVTDAVDQEPAEAPTGDAPA